MNTWSPLWSFIVDSSLWEEPDNVKVVFLTMMALKDADGVYRGNAFNLARRAHKTEREVLEALKVLSSPDKRRLQQQQFGGRRIEAVEEGWLLLNSEKYRRMVSLEMKRARNRRAVKAFRERRKCKTVSGAYLAKEKAYVKAAEEGNEAEMDRLEGDPL